MKGGSQRIHGQRTAYPPRLPAPVVRLPVPEFLALLLRTGAHCPQKGGRPGRRRLRKQTAGIHRSRFSRICGDDRGDPQRIAVYFPALQQAGRYACGDGRSRLQVLHLLLERRKVMFAGAAYFCAAPVNFIRKKRENPLTKF